MTLQTDSLAFDSKIPDPSHPIYFHHSIDNEQGTITIQVLGANLTQVLRHDGIPAAALEKKTSGFLAAVDPSGAKRVVLVWAESGHGCNKNGDGLTATAHILGNKAWTRGAIRLARVLGVDLTSPFDAAHKQPEAVAAERGLFQASHVEVKLATYLVYMLLRVFGEGITTGSTGIPTLTEANLAKLCHARWRGGGRPRFEIYVSRDNCRRCGCFLDRLWKLTGLQVDLRCRQRLVEMSYQRQALLTPAEKGLTVNRADDRQGEERRRHASLGEAAGSAEADAGAASGHVQTIEKDGVIFYVPPAEIVPATNDASAVPATRRPPQMLSKHHLSKVNKPLPGTPVTTDPMAFPTGCGVGAEWSAPRDRSPRPYAMSMWQ